MGDPSSKMAREGHLKGHGPQVPGCLLAGPGPVPSLSGPLSLHLQNETVELDDFQATSNLESL